MISKISVSPHNKMMIGIESLLLFVQKEQGLGGGLPVSCVFLKSERSI